MYRLCIAEVYARTEVLVLLDATLQVERSPCGQLFEFRFTNA